ncbi:unnamed protein product [Arctogadus glacialis]
MRSSRPRRRAPPHPGNFSPQRRALPLAIFALPLPPAACPSPAPGSPGQEPRLSWRSRDEPGTRRVAPPRPGGESLPARGPRANGLAMDPFMRGPRSKPRDHPQLPLYSCLLMRKRHTNRPGHISIMGLCASPPST